MSTIETICFAAMGLVAFLAMSRALADHSQFGNPRLLAGLVALIGVIGLASAGKGWLSTVLIPSAAMVVALAAVGAGIVWVRRHQGGRSLDEPAIVPVQNPKHKNEAQPAVSPVTYHNPWRKTP